MLIVSSSNLLVDSIVKLLGDYFLVVEMENEKESLKKEELRVWDQYPEIVKQEMTDILKEKGVDEQSSRKMVSILSKYENILNQNLFIGIYLIFFYIYFIYLIFFLIFIFI